MKTVIDLKQTKSLDESGGSTVYKVLNQITYSLGIPSEVFVFDRETQEFSNVASVWQLQNLPVGYETALSTASKREDMERTISLAV